MNTNISDMKHSERLQYLKTHKYQNDEILPYIQEHVINFNQLNPDFKKIKGKYQKYDQLNHPIISRPLADIIFILVDKILKTSKFKGYTTDWKDNFRSNAYLLVCKYVHNFDLKETNAIGYLYMSIDNAMSQVLKKHKTYSHSHSECSIDIYHNDTDIESYPESCIIYMESDYL